MKTLIPLLLASAISTAAQADINIGMVLSTTGPGASLGIPQSNTVPLMPQEIAGQRVNYIVLDDGTDSTSATRAARKLTAESNVDVIIGATTVPASAAVAQVAEQAHTPQIALAPYLPNGDAHKWVFTIAQTNHLMAKPLVDHMSSAGIKTLGYIGFNDVWGEDWYNVLNDLLPTAGITLIANERFNRTDTSVSGQVLKVTSKRPDAVLIGATGTPAALPHKELRRLGYKGVIYHTHGAANSAFRRIGGKDLEGAILPAGPIVVWDQLPAGHPAKEPASEYAKAYEAKYGPQTLSPFGAYVFDAVRLIEAAAPEALKQGQPGTEAFRLGLRDLIEKLSSVPGAHGPYTFSSEDHSGHDSQARVLLTIKEGQWALLPVAD